MKKTKTCLLLLLALMMMEAVAWANMAKPWVEGDPVAEPIGVFREIHIRSEQLHFDFRPLASKTPIVHIEAVYHIESTGPKAISTGLYFVAPGLRTGAVMLDGKPLKSQEQKRKLPAAWRLTRRSKEANGLLFRASLTPGKHVIKVNYTAKPRVRLRSTGLIVRTYKVHYVFGPARKWASFGKLTIKAKLPKGWSFHQNPLGLKQQGDEWVHQQQGLPQKDVVKLGVHPPQGLLVIWGAPTAIIWMLGFLLLLWVAWKINPWVQGKANSSTLAIIGRGASFGLLVAVLYGVLNWGGLYWNLLLVSKAKHMIVLGYETLLWFFVGSLVLPLVGLIASIAIWLFLANRPTSA